MFNENKDITKGQLEENIFLHAEESESEDDSTPIKDLCLISEESIVEKINLKSFNKCMKNSSKRDKKRKIPKPILNLKSDVSFKSNDIPGQAQTGYVQTTKYQWGNQIKTNPKTSS